ncbi:hypothetical protein FQA39_LY01135 [Lamprigera yunnana]|nr:hypothetical protein FQA39_LY01135 [Lamprigera yunnana]
MNTQKAGPTNIKKQKITFRNPNRLTKVELLAALDASSDELYSSDDNINFVPADLESEESTDDDDGGDTGALTPPQPCVTTPTQVTIELAAPTTNVPNWSHDPSDMIKFHF